MCLKLLHCWGKHQGATYKLNTSPLPNILRLPVPKSLLCPIGSLREACAVGRCSQPFRTWDAAASGKITPDHEAENCPVVRTPLRGTRRRGQMFPSGDRSAGKFRQLLHSTVDNGRKMTESSPYLREQHCAHSLVQLWAGRQAGARGKKSNKKLKNPPTPPER